MVAKGSALLIDCKGLEMLGEKLENRLVAPVKDGTLVSFARQILSLRLGKFRAAVLIMERVKVPLMTKIRMRSNSCVCSLFCYVFPTHFVKTHMFYSTNASGLFALIALFIILTTSCFQFFIWSQPWRQKSYCLSCIQQLRGYLYMNYKGSRSCFLSNSTPPWKSEKGPRRSCQTPLHLSARSHRGHSNTVSIW